MYSMFIKTNLLKINLSLNTKYVKKNNNNKKWRVNTGQNKLHMDEISFCSQKPGERD